MPRLFFLLHLLENISHHYKLSNITIDFTVLISRGEGLTVTKLNVISETIMQ